MERIISGGPKPVLVGTLPALIQWHCPGARRIDQGFLRFGIIARAPWSCGANRSTRWNDATGDLRHRAIEARVLQLAFNGWI